MNGLARRRHVGAGGINLADEIEIEAAASFEIVAVGVARVKHAAVADAVVQEADEAEHDHVHPPSRSCDQNGIGGFGMAPGLRGVEGELLERVGQLRGG